MTPLPEAERASAAVPWPDDVDDVLGGDVTAALAYVTPAGGAVVTAVATCGARDRERGTVSFTTSLGFPRKLQRILRDPRVALACTRGSTASRRPGSSCWPRASPAST